MNLHLAIISKAIPARNERAVSEVKRMVRGETHGTYA